MMTDEADRTERTQLAQLCYGSGQSHILFTRDWGETESYGKVSK